MWQTDKSPSRTCLDILKKDVKVLQLELKISTKNIQSNTSPHLGFKRPGNHLELNSKTCNEFFFLAFMVYLQHCSVGLKYLNYSTWGIQNKLVILSNEEAKLNIKYKCYQSACYILSYLSIIRPVRRRWIVKYNSQKSSQQKPEYKSFFFFFLL